ncbi:hypothetical protein FQN57_004938 [Myotisia sp. PD_48]|nr:hypothetical protein FQN57_004938 [Myotisia sp. PD_48]
MSFKNSWRLLVAAASTAAVFLNAAQASPSVNVALKASFNSAPYLMELLETAAEENASSYFPLLDRIADGVFAEATTDKELYDQFVQELSSGGHITDLESLSSFKLALSLRSTAPRIQAHYQYYNTSVKPSLMVAQDAVCQVWAHYEGAQYCSSTLEHAQQPISSDRSQSLEQVLPFDRILEDTNGGSEQPSPPTLILYADIMSPLFSDFHTAVSKRARAGEFSYRVRYRPSTANVELPHPLYVSGYGVELALKRTDYIVIDDRDAETKGDQKPTPVKAKPTLGAEDDLRGSSTTDLKPLSSSEVSTLGLNAASFVMNSENPFETLIRLSQDFPRHSKTIANFNATPEFLAEYEKNQELGLSSGLSAIWINGVHMQHRHIDAFSLLSHLRHERKLMNSFNELGLPPVQAVKLLSDPVISASQTAEDIQRFDYRDDIEGGNVIIWLNNIATDNRYEGWPDHITSVREIPLLQPLYPGQLPQVRRDIHNVVIPMDLANKDNIEILVEQVRSFVQNRIPIRFGIVPIHTTPASIEQAKIAHHLYRSYGIVTLLTYFKEVHQDKKFIAPSKASFEAAIKEKQPRDELPVLDLEDVLKASELDDRIKATKAYLKRLDATSENPPLFVNAVAIEMDDNWLRALIGRISKDLEGIQRHAYEGTYNNDSWLPKFYLGNAVSRRNHLIVPEDPNDIEVKDINNAYTKHKDAFNSVPRIPGATDLPLEKWAQMAIVADIDDEQGMQQLAHLVEFRKSHPEVEVLIFHSPSSSANRIGISTALRNIMRDKRDLDLETISTLVNTGDYLKVQDQEAFAVDNAFSSVKPILSELDIPEQGIHILVNGRIIGPLNQSTIFDVQDLELALSYEREKRIIPVATVLRSVQATDKIADHMNFSRLTALVSLATVSDIPAGIYDNGPMVRTSVFADWTNAHSGLSLSTTDNPSIQIVAAIDPTSETTQRWIPILKVLSDLNGVSLKLFLNPHKTIKELPIKRFYRHVLHATPTFHADGSLKQPRASFNGIPEEALLTLGMDVPPSWLVAPKESVHDLDNIKLSSLTSGRNVDAIYELEHILIEGHSRDVTANTPPRGVQLLLGTKEDPHFADTIIMANLGYFQFKAQPGHWQITLKPGRSERIFNIDSLGAMGYAPKPGDESTAVCLMSFQGRTLFPRLSRKLGHESEDVLEVPDNKPSSAKNYLSKGLNFASGVLSSMTGSQNEAHADINIFSVASGHLYERMLNIMMLSVMKHTKHTVKFWFIEQFLSPSFKSFLPHLAQEYGFSYEMVTYKWPHWLRSQKEKQREIWGYKILFLDVLFPLSLDKVIFVDADQIVRTDMWELVNFDLEGAPYGFTPMCDSRTEMEGFRFWKQGYWQRFLRGLPYHISALYVVDLNRFRAMAAGDRLRGQYQALSADPGSLSNLDQDLPNNMQRSIPIKSLPQDWLWCETWCSDEALTTAKTIDLCNNPETKEPKLDRARRQVPEWTLYDEQAAELARKVGASEANDEESESNDNTKVKDEL